ncbi:MAG: HEAT repeat domain-containing protein [Anaerolineales bacterium]|nr:HEAT repeat domain-containing protein [Anaerolineales bacterium]
MTDTPVPPAEPSAAPSPAEPSLSDLLSNVTHSDPATRLEAVEQLGRLKSADKSALRALEKAAAQDDDPGVREAALLALAASVYRTLQQQDSRLSLPLRRSILAEIERWSADGLLPAHLTRLLQQRYNFDPSGPAPAAAPAPVPAGPRPTLTQVLLSETTIKVALYLGAFFVVAAAFILAAIFDVLRLPILGLATVGFFGRGPGLETAAADGQFCAVHRLFLLAAH